MPEVPQTSFPSALHVLCPFLPGVPLLPLLPLSPVPAGPSFTGLLPRVPPKVQTAAAAEAPGLSRWCSSSVSSSIAAAGPGWALAARLARVKPLLTRRPPGRSAAPQSLRPRRSRPVSLSTPCGQTRQLLGPGAVRGAEEGVRVTAHFPPPQTAGPPPTSPPPPPPRPSLFDDPPTIHLPWSCPSCLPTVPAGGQGKGGWLHPELQAAPRQGDSQETGAPPAARACGLLEGSSPAAGLRGPLRPGVSSAGCHPGPGSRCG